VIQKATPDDIPVIVSMQRALEAEGSLHGYRADGAEEWAARDLAWTFLATADARPCGFVHCRPREYAGECVLPADGRTLEIAELVVAASHRGRGIGHELVLAVERDARRRGYTHLRVYSASKRFDDVVRFYRDCGFVPWYCELTRGIGAAPSAAGDAESPHT
jgi:GNAT superfamily N-acetyltransferase